MTNEEIANQLLWPVWKGIPEGYKMRYARSIWDQFEANIRSAAYTSNLPKFLDALCRKLSVQIAAEDLLSVTSVIQSQYSREILRALRDETMTLVLLCRIRNQERRAEYAKKGEEAN